MSASERGVAEVLERVLVVAGAKSGLHGLLALRLLDRRQVLLGRVVARRASADPVSLGEDRLGARVHVASLEGRVVVSRVHGLPLSRVVVSRLRERQ
jgi:hypothetical protein